MPTAVKLKSFAIFCYVCKERHTYRGETEKEALAQFRRDGHNDEKVPALAPNVGRKSRRYERVIARHNAKVLAEKERQRREQDAARLKAMQEGSE